MSQHIMNDEDIQERVDSLVGRGAKIIDCEKKSSMLTEEVLLLNGVQVKLVGEVGERIKDALKSGQTPPPELLSEILIKAGIENNPVELETTMKVKSNTKTTELSTWRDKDGMLMDEKMKEVEEDDEYHTSSVEVWEKEPDSPVSRYLEYPPNTVSQKSNSQNSQTNNQQRKVNPTGFMETPPLMNPKEISPNQTIEYPKLIREPTRNTNMQLKNSPNFKTPQKESSCYNPTAAFLRRQDNFELPVRVVYETFI